MTALRRIRLARGEWFYDPSAPLGRPGGFGAVYAGHAERVGAIAVKQLHLSIGEAAHRELVVAERLCDRTLGHVLPFLDAGQDADGEAYFTVMPRAERTLQEALDSSGPLGEDEAVPVLLEIVTGLLEVPDLVHRDLKPSNVLYHEGRWKLADFGIARFVEESTSLNTLKTFLTPEYAAPEQWLLQSPSQATDTYAVGCIAYALLSGKPPFAGSVEDLRRQHLETAPASLRDVGAELQQILATLLRKSPPARMRQDRLAERLRRLSAARTGGPTAPTAGFAALATASAEAATRSAEAEAREAASRRAREDRAALARDAKAELNGLINRLYARISETAADATIGERMTIRYLRIPGAKLEVDLQDGMVLSPDAFARSNWDVVTGAIIGVEQEEPRYDWNASLWYRRRGSGEYRWYEVAYQTSGFYSYRGKFEPFALKPEDADRAESPAMAEVQRAYGPHDIDDQFGAFCNRWANLLAAASRGQLRYPPDYGLVG